jgi:glycosyltransferase involved in cell wall biosynthesis
MRVWLLHIGEHLPVATRHPAEPVAGCPPARLCRYGYLAQSLVERGHEVLRWAPTFCHVKKRHRFTADHRLPINDKYAIQFVHSSGYRRNAGVQRLRTYQVLGRRFRQLATEELPPDVIVAAIPSLEWADAAVDYGQRRRIPVVIDVRDLWPDVFLHALPSVARPLGRWLLAPYYRLARRACRQADAIVAVSQTYLDWALELAGRERQPRDLVVPLGFEPEPVPADEMQEKVATLCRRGIDPQRPICLFAGLFERSYDLATVVEAARRLEAAGRGDVQFVLCGDGSSMPSLRRRAAGLHSVHLTGWVDAATLQAAASIATIGLCAYADGALQSLPNKPFEYMAGRLAMVSSLPGEMAALVARHQCGLTYRAGDADSLADCLTSLLSNRRQLESMRRQAYDAWSRHYRSCDVYGRLADRLTSLTAAGTGRAQNVAGPGSRRAA